MKRSMLVALAVALFVVAPLRASDPVGVYCMVDKVVFEPSEAGATKVQIWGAFSVAVPRNRADFTQPTPEGFFGDPRVGDVYTMVQKGYMYFTCPAGQETLCRNEWNDLKSIAGTTKVVGFGSRYATLGTVRRDNVKPDAPDAYALNVGLVPIGQVAGRPGMTNQTQYPDLIAALQAAMKKK